MIRARNSATRLPIARLNTSCSLPCLPPSPHLFRLLHQLALELLSVLDREILSARIHGYIESMPTVWRAIISSSFVGIVHAETRLDRVPMRDSPPSFAVASSSTPSHAASRQTRS